MDAIETVQHHLPAALLVAFRIGGLALFAPILGSSTFPLRVRTLLVFAIAAAVYPALAARGHAVAPVGLDLARLAPAILAEVGIGAAAGLMASIPLMAAQASGHFAGQQMGVGFAQVVNPAAEDESDVVAQLLYFLAVAVFFVAGGLDALVLAVLRSFEHLPLGTFAAPGGMLEFVLGLVASAMELGLRLTAPVLAVVFLESIAMGFMAKTVPQLNILSLGFPIRILASYVTLIVGLGVMQDVMLDETSTALETIVQFFGGGAAIGGDGG